MQIILDIQGMSCASCAAHVEKGLAKQPGVRGVSVNLTTEKAQVEFDPRQITAEGLAKAVDALGYKAILHQPEEKRAGEAKEDGIRRMWARFVAAAVFALPLLYIAMGPMVGLPIPSALDMALHPLRFALAQLLLVLPVIGVGHRFYTGGL